MKQRDYIADQPDSRRRTITLKKPVKAKAKKTGKKAVKKTAKAATKKAVKKVAKKLAKKPVKKAAAKKAVKRAVKRKVAKPARKTAVKVLKKPVKKVAKKASTPARKTKPVAVKKNAIRKPTVIRLPATSPKPSYPPMVEAVLKQLDDAKAEHVTVIDLVNRSTIADTMVIASGRSDRHVNAIADQVVTTLEKHGLKNLRVEGKPQCDWVLVDSGDIIIHVFRPEVRSFYNLEKLWSANAPKDQHA